MEMF